MIAFKFLRFLNLDAKSFLPGRSVVSGQEVVQVNATLGGHGQIKHENARQECEQDGRLVGSDVGELINSAACLVIQKTL
jgi:hypothetical protein